MHGDIERKHFFRAPPIRSSLVDTAMPGIKDYGFNLMPVRQSIRPHDWLDHFAHVHGRNQHVISFTQDWKIGNKTYAIDVKLGSAGLSANSTAVASQRDGVTHPGVFGKTV